MKSEGLHNALCLLLWFCCKMRLTGILQLVTSGFHLVVQGEIQWREFLFSPPGSLGSPEPGEKCSKEARFSSWPLGAIWDKFLARDSQSKHNWSKPNSHAVARTCEEHAWSTLTFKVYTVRTKDFSRLAPVSSRPGKQHRRVRNCRMCRRWKTNRHGWVSMSMP